MNIYEDEINTPASEESPATVVEEELPITPKEVVCPFCGCKEGLDIGGNFKLCSNCGNKYPNDDGVYEPVKFVLEEKPVSSKGSKKSGSKSTGSSGGEEGSPVNRIIAMVLTAIALLLLIVPITYWGKDDLYFSTYGWMPAYHSLYGMIGLGHGFPTSVLICTLISVISLVVTIIALLFKNKALKNGGIYTCIFVESYLFVIHILTKADVLFETMDNSACILNIVIHAIVVILMIVVIVFSKEIGSESKLPKGVLPLWICGSIALIGIVANYIVVSAMNDTISDMYFLITYGYIAGFIISYIFIGISIYCLIKYVMLNKEDKALSRTIALIGNAVLIVTSVILNIIPACC